MEPAAFAVDGHHRLFVIQSSCLAKNLFGEVFQRMRPAVPPYSSRTIAIYWLLCSVSHGEAGIVSVRG